MNLSGMKQLKQLGGILLILFLSCPLAAQNHSIKIKLSGCADCSLLLTEYYGEKNFIVDSAKTDSNGTGYFTMDKEREAGLYKLVINRRTEFDLIYNYEDIEVSTHPAAPQDSMHVLKSRENTLLYDFMLYDYKCRLKLDLLSPVIDYYPKDEKFYAEAEKQFVNLQKERDSHISKLEKDASGTWAIKIISMQKTPFLDPGLRDSDKRTYMKTHYFDGLSFNDPELFRSNVYTNKLVNYMGLYSNKSFNQEQLETELVKAIDVILPTIKANNDVYKFCLEYLVGGFEKYHFDKVLDHIAINYQDEHSCENDDGKSNLQKRLDSYKLMAPGSIAPDFTAPDINGNSVRLSSIEAPRTLVVFWATWCPHCKDLLPEIKKLYDEQTEKEFEVIAISIDTVAENWKEHVESGKYSWINCSELKGWDSDVAIKYNLYATPTIFVLDRNRKILAKPLSLHGIVSALR